MELGEKLRQARLEAGLSQRQLCGEEITRNMLSQIENGAARPSMGTLRFLAARLGKPVSFFLEETVVVSPNQALMDTARSQFDTGAFAAALDTLCEYRTPDPVYDREHSLLKKLTLLALAEAALAQGREPYARELLDQAGAIQPLYLSGETERRRTLLLSRLRGANLSTLCASLPSLDPDLLLRAQAALDSRDPGKAARLLDAAEDQESPQWNLLRGKAHLARQEYAAAARCFHTAEASHPQQTAPLLEACYRELGDFQKAYLYACKQR